MAGVAGVTGVAGVAAGARLVRGWRGWRGWCEAAVVCSASFIDVSRGGVRGVRTRRQSHVIYASPGARAALFMGRLARLEPRRAIYGATFTSRAIRH